MSRPNLYQVVEELPDPFAAFGKKYLPNLFSVTQFSREMGYKRRRAYRIISRLVKNGQVKAFRTKAGVTE